jgi:hypothetical protein
MASSIEYRRYAENCLRLIAYAGSSEAKAFLITMAWHRLAQDLENIERPAEDAEAAHAAERRQADV